MYIHTHDGVRRLRYSWREVNAVPVFAHAERTWTQCGSTRTICFCSHTCAERILSLLSVNLTTLHVFARHVQSLQQLQAVVHDKSVHAASMLVYDNAHFVNTNTVESQCV